MGWAAKTLLGLGGTRQESLGARRQRQSLPEKMGGQAGDPRIEGVSALSPTPHASPQTLEQDIYPLQSHRLQPSALDSSLHLMYQCHKATAPQEQTQTLQLYYPF